MASEEKPTDTEELAEFREQWRAEIREKSTNAKDLPQAEELYWMGVAAEENRDMSSAILYYRQAMQLVPDIEKRATSSKRLTSRQAIEGGGGGEEEKKEEEEREKGERDGRECGSDGDLSSSISALSITDTLQCQENTPNKMTHISVLPLEIIRYILILTVLRDLDLRTLEQFGMVCKRFYIFSREEVIWRKACTRLWGEKECNALATPTCSWRQLYITKPHVHFNGVYISQSVYVRTGERSLDRLYRPFHTVVYYRYLRFYADGTVLYMTSPDTPSIIVNKLNINSTAGAAGGGGMLLGYYTQLHDNITVVVKRDDAADQQSPRSHKRRTTPINTSNIHQRFHMELTLKHNFKKLSSQLQWKKFTCHNIQNSTGRIQVSEFHIDYTYTPFYFSRVKSYSLIH